MVTIRELRHEEWDRIKDLPKPDFSRVFIAEDETEEIIGHAVVQTLVHLEPLEVDSEYHGTLVPARLFSAAYRACGNNPVYTSTDQPKVAAMLSLVGFRSEGLSLVRSAKSRRETTEDVKERNSK